MSTYSQFKTNASREREGITHDLGSAGKFRLARAGGANSAFEKRLMSLSKPYRRAIATGTIERGLADSLLATAFSETVVLGWEGVTGEDGKPIPYSAEACKKLLLDLPELFAELRKAAEDAALFRDETLESDAGNSQTASGTR